MFPEINKDSLPDALGVVPSNALVRAADDFLRSNDIIGPTQINNLILVTLCAIPKIKNISMDIDTENKKIDVIVFLNRWNMLFANKAKIVSSIDHLWIQYIPNYSIKVRFAVYGKNNFSTTK